MQHVCGPRPQVITRRRFATTGAAGAIGLLAACRTSAPAPDGIAAPQAADLKGVTVEYWIQNALDHPEGMAKDKVMQDFTARNPHGIAVSATGGATIQKVVAAAAGGAPPDLVDGFHFNMCELFARGATVEIDAELKGNADWSRARPNIYPEIATGFTWKGKLFAVPLYSSFFAMYYQPEYLKRVHLPVPPPRNWGWDEFLDYCRKASSPPEITGYDDQWSYSRTGMMVLNNGHRFISQDGTKFSYNSPEALDAVEFQLTMIKQGLMRTHDGSAGGGYSEKLPEGKVVFQFAVAARVPRYREQGVQFGTCYYPLGPGNRARQNYTHGESYGLAVFRNKDGKKQQAALLAALWATHPESALVFAEVGGTPPAYRNAVESPELQARFRQDPDVWAFYELLPTYIPMPNFPGFASVRALGDQKIREIWAGSVSARDGLNEYTRLAQQTLDEALRL